MNVIHFIKLTAVLSTLIASINAEAQLLGRGGSLGGTLGGNIGGAMNGSFNHMGGSQDVFNGRERAIKSNGNAAGAVDSNVDAASQIKHKAMQANTDTNGQGQAEFLSDVNAKQSASDLSQNTGKTETKNAHSLTQTNEANGKAIASMSKQASTGSTQNTSDSTRSISTHRTITGTASASGNTQASASTAAQSEHE